ncbi:MAG: glycosyltransferase family 39 protein [Anaerolineales bacterium]|nr:glycosyltransferase family 39 protein [Anaerolineales bacterium]
MWLEPFLAATPTMAWFFLGIGLPWAFAILPRRDWHDWATVSAVGLALGPLFGTTWLFVLGSFGTFTWFTALSGTLVLAAMGAAIAWPRRLEGVTDLPEPAAPRYRSLTTTLWVMIALGILASAWDTAFWPFLRYDTLWTFGYNAKIFMLEGHIPARIDYYPQMVPLTFTFAQLSWGEINDHAARAAVPWFILSSTMAAYLLGWRVYGQRIIGLVTAAFWLLSPAALVWSSSGDLEHVVALYFTLGIVFYVLAWRTLDWRYSVLSGLMVGGSMWTKPTAGAYVLGVGLVMAFALMDAYRRSAWPWFGERFRITLLSMITAAPLAGMWYIRNILLGHRWTNLPAAYWQDLAQRSGLQLQWLWILVVLVTSWLLINAYRQHDWQRAVLVLAAFALISIAILPTMLMIPADGWSRDTTWAAINGIREPQRPMSLIEGVLLLVGVALLLWQGRLTWQQLATDHRQAVWLSWGVGLPFFAVYFWSFSYHYRLGLTITPLLQAPVAALLVALLLPILSQNRARRIATNTVIVLLCLPSLLAATYHTALNTFNDTGIDTDREKYAYANPALMQTVEVLEDYAATQATPNLRILAPGENRLSFYFPDWTINDDFIPTDVTNLQGYDVYINYSGGFLWTAYDLIPNQVWAWTRLAWVYPLPPVGETWAPDGPYGQPIARVLKPIFTPIDDGRQRHELYAIDVEAAFADVTPENPLTDVIFGDTVQLLGYDLPTTTFQRGQTLTLKLYWRGINPPTTDYSVFVHLIDSETGEILDQVDGDLMGGLFPLRILSHDMILQDKREWAIDADLPPTRKAEIHIGVYNPVLGPRLPVTVEGEPVGDLVVIESGITLE